jgi:hypothetical protein
MHTALRFFFPSENFFFFFFFLLAPHMKIAANVLLAAGRFFLSFLKKERKRSN